MIKNIVTLPINLHAELNLAHHFKAGAIVLFSGEVRNHHNGKPVEYLEYEAHVEMAEQSIALIMQEAKSLWPLHYVACRHRIGKINLCESAVIVLTSASHRGEAYEANRYIIDKVKAEVPIWKKEYFSDGSETWA